MAPSAGIEAETKGGGVGDELEKEKKLWQEAERSKWSSLAEELREELEASRLQAEKLKRDYETEKKCAEDLREAMQLSMEQHVRMLEQYADLEERHVQLLARHRRIQEGTEDVRKAAARAGVRGAAESKFVNALASEISALRVERERERRFLRDEITELRTRLEDTAEAVAAAGELLVRHKEAEEAAAAAQKRVEEADREVKEANEEMEKMKREHQREIRTLNHLVMESEIKQHTDSGKEDDALWFSGYDRCNI